MNNVAAAESSAFGGLKNLSGSVMLAIESNTQRNRSMTHPPNTVFPTTMIPSTALGKGKFRVSAHLHCPCCHRASENSDLSVHSSYQCSHCATELKLLLHTSPSGSYYTGLTQIN